MGKDPLLLMWLVVVSFVTFWPLACRVRAIMVFVGISLTTSSYRVLYVLISMTDDCWKSTSNTKTMESLHFCLCDPGFQHSPVVAALQPLWHLYVPSLWIAESPQCLSKRLTGKLASPQLPSVGMQVLWSLLLSCLTTYSTLGAELVLAVLQPWRKDQNPSSSEEGLSSLMQITASDFRNVMRKKTTVLVSLSFQGYLLLQRRPPLFLRHRDPCLCQVSRTQDISGAQPRHIHGGQSLSHATGVSALADDS